MWLYLDYRKCVMASNRSDMSGNTDWVYYDGELPGEALTDDHGAALYRLDGGVLIERTLEERMRDWPQEQQGAQTDEERIAELEQALAALLRGETA